MIGVVNNPVCHPVAGLPDLCENVSTKSQKKTHWINWIEVLIRAPGFPRTPFALFTLHIANASLTLSASKTFCTTCNLSLSNKNLNTFTVFVDCNTTRNVHHLHRSNRSHCSPQYNIVCTRFASLTSYTGFRPLLKHHLSIYTTCIPSNNDVIGRFHSIERCLSPSYNQSIDCQDSERIKLNFEFTD